MNFKKITLLIWALRKCWGGIKQNEVTIKLLSDNHNRLSAVFMVFCTAKILPSSSFYTHEPAQVSCP